MPEDKVTEALRFAAEPLSLSEPLREDGDAELGDVVEDRSAESPFEVAATALLPEAINRLLAPPDDREREILITDERRGGTEWVRTCRSRWAPQHRKKK